MLRARLQSGVRTKSLTTNVLAIPCAYSPCIIGDEAPLWRHILLVFLYMRRVTDDAIFLPIYQSNFALLKGQPTINLGNAISALARSEDVQHSIISLGINTELFFGQQLARVGRGELHETFS